MSVRQERQEIRLILRKVPRIKAGDFALQAHIPPSDWECFRFGMLSVEYDLLPDPELTKILTLRGVRSSREIRISANALKASKENGEW